MQRQLTGIVTHSLGFKKNSRLLTDPGTLRVRCPVRVRAGITFKKQTQHAEPLSCPVCPHPLPRQQRVRGLRKPFLRREQAGPLRQMRRQPEQQLPPGLPRRLGWGAAQGRLQRLQRHRSEPRPSAHAHEDVVVVCTHAHAHAHVKIRTFMTFCAPGLRAQTNAVIARRSRSATAAPTAVARATRT